jgi:hypothetical protein
MNKYLYHYTGEIALKNIVQINSFWITKSEYLNDATEQEVNQLFEVFYQSVPQNGFYSNEKMTLFLAFELFVKREF